MDFSASRTAVNLMRAFAGESMARNRYTFAASAAKKEGLECIEQVFLYTAGQEKEHAEIFYGHLKSGGLENLVIGDAGYPVDLGGDTLALLRLSRHNEFEEADPVYPAFAETAREEGFEAAARSFELIAPIERVHGERFEAFARFLEQNKLFVSDVSTGWICLNCGYVFNGTQAPGVCPVCSHGRGYFVRLELSPWHSGN